MPAVETGKIRNVAVTGHRGTGKTSLVEAMLFQAGAVNRLGAIEQGSTVGDWDEDEQRRQMTISASLTHLEWQGRKINLIDTPGEPSFQGETVSSIRVVEGALIVVSGVMGVEVQTSRVWARAEELGLARVFFVNMLDRERADFFRVLNALQHTFSARAVAIHLPIGVEHELTGIVDLLHMKAYASPEGAKEAAPGEIPAEMADQVAEYREKLLDSVVETDEGLMERYLEGQELSDEEVAHALKDAVTRGEIFPVACPFAGRINVFRVIEGTVGSDATLVNSRSHNKERIGQLLTLQGKEHDQADEFGPGDLGAVAKLKDTLTGDLLLDAERDSEPPKIEFPEPVMSFAITPKAKGDEEKLGTALRRLSEEDPTRVMRRFGVEVELRQPRVPYLETIRRESKGHGRYKKQTGGRGQFGDCHIVLEPIEGHTGYEFVDKIAGGVI